MLDKRHIFSLEYSDDGLYILIDKGWLERIPEAADRKELVGV